MRLTKRLTTPETKLSQIDPFSPTMDAECCICFEETTNRVIPCGHTMCKSCILRWCDKKVQCPLCKTVLVCPCPTSKLNMLYPDILLNPVPGASEIGLTLADGTDGVLVKALAKKSLAAECGLKIGSVITHINDIPTKTHAMAIQIINAAQHISYPLHLTLAEPATVSLKTSLFHIFQKCKRCLKR